MSKQDKLSTLYTAAMAPRKYECADRDETLRMIGEQDEAARRAKVDEAVARLIIEVDKHVDGVCHGCAAEHGAPESAFTLPDLSDITALKQSLAALRESLESCK